MKCDQCDAEYFPDKSWQRFCCAKCRNDFNNLEKKRVKVAEAEDRLAGRLNGLSGAGPKIDLAALGVMKPIKPFKLRKFA